MQARFHVQCKNGKQGVKVCSFEPCKQNSIMCSNDDCKCHQSHESCFINTSISSLWKALKIKGQSFKQILGYILEWYDIQLKKFSVEREELKQQVENHQIILIEDQNQLFQYLKQGKSNQIQSQLVSKVITSLRQNKVYVNEQNTNKMKSFLKDKGKQINNLLNQFKEQKILYISSFKNKENEFRFSHTKHHQLLQIINNQTIKSINVNSIWQTAFIQPKIIKNTKCRLQLLKDSKNHYLFVGVCQLNKTDKIDNINYGNYESGIMFHCRYPTSNYYGQTKGTKRIKNQITLFEEKDIIEIQCLFDTNIVIFNNITKNTSTEFSIYINKNIPIYFIVQLYTKDCEIMLLNDY